MTFARQYTWDGHIPTPCSLVTKRPIRHAQLVL
jgi:hypothetical protein